MTNRQQQIYDFIRDYEIENGYAPMLPEIQSHFGLRSRATVAGHLDRLEAKGLICREYKKLRGITLLA